MHKFLNKQTTKYFSFNYLFINFCILFIYLFSYVLQQDQVKHISVEERDPSSVKVTWPGLGNSSNANILTGYDVYYASHPNDSCKKGSFRFDIKVKVNSCKNIAQ